MLNRESLKLGATKLREWWLAFLFVLWAPQKVVGRRKQLALSFALVWTISTPVLTFLSARPYMGEVPSDTEIVKATGNISFGFEQHGVRSRAVSTFITDNGAAINLDDPPSMLPEIKKLMEGSGKETARVYLEGYRLGNGSGRFWITYAATPDGHLLLSRAAQSERLKRASEPFGTVLFWMYLIILPVWVITFFNVRDARTSIGA